MKKIFLLLLTVLLIGGCGEEKNSADIKNSNQTFTVGFDEFAPMGFTDENGNIVGFDVELAKEAAKRLGVEFEFKPIEWNSKEAELKSGRINIIWNGLDITPEGQQHILFSKPYMDNRQILLVKKGNPKNIKSLEDLSGKLVATQAGSNSETYVDENEKLRNSFAKFSTYRTIGEGFAALNGEKYDVLIIDEIAARYEVNKNPNMFEIVSVTVGPVTEFGIGFRKGNTELRDRVQKVFDEMIADGTAAKISKQWFGTNLIKNSK